MRQVSLSPSTDVLGNELGNAALMTDNEDRVPRRFADVLTALSREPGVAFGDPGAKKTFGHSALKINDKIFAMVSAKGDFVVKLPARRVDALEASGAGKRFQAGDASR